MPRRCSDQWRHLKKKRLAELLGRRKKKLRCLEEAQTNWSTFKQLSLGSCCPVSWTVIGYVQYIPGFPVSNIVNIQSSLSIFGRGYSMQTKEAMGERGLHICAYEYVMYEFIIHYGRRLCRVSALGTPTPPSVTTHPCSVSNPSKPIGFLTGMKLGFVIWNLIRRRVDTASFLHRENSSNGHKQKAQGSVYRCCIVTINITSS